MIISNELQDELYMEHPDILRGDEFSIPHVHPDIIGSEEGSLPTAPSEPFQTAEPESVVGGPVPPAPLREGVIKRDPEAERLEALGKRIVKWVEYGGRKPHIRTLHEADQSSKTLRTEVAGSSYLKEEEPLQRFREINQDAMTVVELAQLEAAKKRLRSRRR